LNRALQDAGAFQPTVLTMHIDAFLQNLKGFLWACQSYDYKFNPGVLKPGNWIFLVAQGPIFRIIEKK
jgi:hypothetical protein